MPPPLVDPLQAPAPAPVPKPIPAPRPTNPLIAEQERVLNLKKAEEEAFQLALPLQKEKAEAFRFSLEDGTVPGFDFKDRGTLFPFQNALEGAGRDALTSLSSLAGAGLDLVGATETAQAVEKFGFEQAGELRAFNQAGDIERERQAAGNETALELSKNTNQLARSAVMQAAGGKLGRVLAPARIAKHGAFLGLLTTGAAESAGFAIQATTAAGGSSAEAKAAGVVAFASEFLITLTFQSIGLGGLTAAVGAPFREVAKQSLKKAFLGNKAALSGVADAVGKVVKGGVIQTSAELTEELLIPTVDDSISAMLIGVTRADFLSPDFIKDLLPKWDATWKQVLLQMGAVKAVQSSPGITRIGSAAKDARAEIKSDREAEQKRVADEQAEAAQAQADAQAADAQANANFEAGIIRPDLELDDAIANDPEASPINLTGEKASLDPVAEAQKTLKRVRAVDVLPEGTSQRDLDGKMADLETRLKKLSPNSTITRDGNALILTDQGGLATAFMFMSPATAAKSASSKADRPNAIASIEASGRPMVDANGKVVPVSEMTKMKVADFEAMLVLNNAAKGWMMNSPRGGNFPVDADTLVALTDPNAVLEEYHHKLVTNQMTDSEIRAASQYLKTVGKYRGPDGTIDEILGDGTFTENLAAEYIAWRNEKLAPKPEIKAKRPGVIRRFFQRIFGKFKRAQKAMAEIPVHPLQELNEATLRGDVGARAAQRSFTSQEAAPFSTQASAQQKVENKQARERLTQDKLEQQVEDAPRLAQLKADRLAGQEAKSELAAERTILQGKKQALAVDKQALAELTLDTRETEAAAREQRAITGREKALASEEARIDRQARLELEEEARLDREIVREEAARDKEAERELKQDVRIEDTEGRQQLATQKRVDRQNVEDQRREQRQKQLAQGEQRLAQGQQRVNQGQQAVDQGQQRLDQSQRRININETKVRLAEAQVTENARAFLTAAESNRTPEQSRVAQEIIELENEIDMQEDLIEETEMSPEQLAEVEADIDQMVDRIDVLANSVPRVQNPGKLFSIKANPAATPEGRQTMADMQAQTVITKQTWQELDRMGEEILNGTRHKTLIQQWERIVNTKATLGGPAQSALRMLIERSNAVVLDPTARNKEAARLRAARLMAIDIKQGTEAGRELGSRRDRILNPEQRRAELQRLMLEPPPKLITKVRALQKRGAFKDASKLLKDWNDTQLLDTLARLKEAGIDLSQTSDGDLDNTKFFQLRSDILAKRSKIDFAVAAGLLNQIAYNQLLSPVSSGKALAGNLIFGSLIGTSTVVEATVNEIVKLVRGGRGIKGAADLATVRAAAAAMVHNILGALRNGVYTAFTGRSTSQEKLGFLQNTFEQQEGFSDPIDVITGNPIAKGFLRMSIGLNTSLLVGVDEVMNTIVSSAMTAAAAARQATNNGLKGDAVSKFVEQAAQDPTRMLDEDVIKNVKRVTDQIALRSDFSESDDAVLRSEKALNKTKSFARAGENFRNFDLFGLRPLQLVIPFYRTIANSIIESARYAPLTGAANALVKSIDAATSRGTELSDEANLSLLQQGVRLSMMMAVIASLEGIWDAEDEDESLIQGTKGRLFSEEQRLERRLGRENSVGGVDISQLDPIGSMLISYANARDAFKEKGASPEAMVMWVNENSETFFRRNFGDSIIKAIKTPKEEFVGTELGRRSPLKDFAGIGRVLDNINASEIRSRKDDTPIRDLFGDALKRREDSGVFSTIAALGGVTNLDDLKGEKRDWAVALLKLQPAAKALDNKGVIPGGVREAPKGVTDIDKYRQLKGQRFFELLQRIGDPGSLEANARTIKKVRRANVLSTRWATGRSK